MSDASEIIEHWKRVLRTSGPVVFQRVARRHARLLAPLDPETSEELFAALDEMTPAALPAALPAEKCGRCRHVLPAWQIEKGRCRACRAIETDGRPE